MNAGRPATFDVASQAGETISNVGGNQNVYFEGARPGRAAGVARAVLALGLAAFFCGLGVLGLTGVETAWNLLSARDTEGIVEPYTQYVAATWLPAVVLLAAGVVLTRFARVFTGR